ncbi:MAG: hypothetical protein B6245_02850 [Desulfobacteraceae bacterium 4572_88]|nr:MAG: hypothetical protein B6245_02850 [Desulfobacteraceae bacterium 4572_88]
MEQCPTCNAKYIGKPVCHRCKAPLEYLAGIEKQAERHLEEAVAAFESKAFEKMFFHAGRAFSLHRTPRSAKVMACASLLARKFDLALSAWQMNS